ncbi:phosphoglucosamine mutase [Fibrobacterota bacterium]
MKKLPIMSVSGIRGKMGETISPYLFSTIAYLQTKQVGGGKILVGRDTRPSGEMLAKAVFRGIRCAGGIPVNLGIATTPTTCFATKHFKASGGIIITASHNPLPYNGYKMVHTTGRLYSGSECEEIYQQFYKGGFPTEKVMAQNAEEPEEELDAVTPHIEAIVRAVDTEVIRKRNIKIAVDSINGAAGVIFPKLCDALSVSWKGVHNKLDGDFVHNPEPRPEHLGDLARLLLSDSEFWGGFVFDPDADRLALMGEHGEPISEERTLALVLENILQKEKSNVVINLSTTMLIDEIARKYGVSVIRTRIGEANVVEGMKQHGTIIGGEGNGGVIYPKVSTARDGLVGMALILELMATSGKRLFELTSLWSTYPIIKEKILLGEKKASDVIANLTEKFSEETIDTQDGIKIIRDYGWVHLRPSNTEPILRCYAEAKTNEQARELADMVLNQI